MKLDGLAQDELAGSVDDIRQQHHGCNQHQVSMLEDKSKATLAAHWTFAFPGRLGPWGSWCLTTVNDRCQDHANDENRRAQHHHRVRSDLFEETARNVGPENRTERTSNTRNRKKPAALLGSVDVICKCPHLRHEHQIEKPNPDEKRNGDREVHVAEE